MKISKLIPILQGIYSSNPEAQVLFKIDSEYAEKLAKTSLLEDNFIDSFYLDIEEIQIFCEEEEIDGPTLNLKSIGYEESNIYKLAKEFDEKYKIE